MDSAVDIDSAEPVPLDPPRKRLRVLGVLCVLLIATVALPHAYIGYQHTRDIDNPVEGVSALQPTPHPKLIIPCYIVVASPYVSLLLAGVICMTLARDNSIAVPPRLAGVLGCVIAAVKASSDMIVIGLYSLKNTGFMDMSPLYALDGGSGLSMLFISFLPPRLETTLALTFLLLPWFVVPWLISSQRTQERGLWGVLMALVYSASWSLTLWAPFAVAILYESRITQIRLLMEGESVTLSYPAIMLPLLAASIAFAVSALRVYRRQRKREKQARQALG